MTTAITSHFRSPRSDFGARRTTTRPSGSRGSRVSTEGVRVYQAAALADPVGWMGAALGVRLWRRQAQIVESVRDHPRVAVRSSNAIGKSFVAACLTAWYLETRSPGYVVTTSSSWRSVEKVLWPEIRRIVRGAPCSLGGTLLKTEWQRGDQWGAFGVSADVPENFAGFRTRNGVFVIVDEASAIEPEIMEAILGLMASADSRVLLIGNPLRPSGSFYEAFRSSAWKTLHVSALECPNVAAGREIIPGLATRSWVESRKKEWGEDSPAYQARVLGEFPDEGEDTLIPLSWIEVALERQSAICNLQSVRLGGLRMGVDVARYGSDRTAIVIRDCGAVRHVESHLKQSTMATAGRILSAMRHREIPPERVYVDDSGLGGGVTDRLREQGFRVQGVNFAGQARDAERFANVRAECYWNLRDALNPALAEAEADRLLSIPPEFSELAHECTLPRIGYTSRGQIKLEDKELIKRRHGRSPDLADALALTFAAGRPEPRAYWL